MAKLPKATLTTIFNLQVQLLEQIDEVTAVEFALFEEYGETDETIPELNEIRNIIERADTYYSRFSITLRRIYESQPAASNATLELLTLFIEQAQDTVDAIKASIQDIRNNWNLS